MLVNLFFTLILPLWFENPAIAEAVHKGPTYLIRTAQWHDSRFDSTARDAMLSN
jgi:hypothetical protein